LAGGFLLKFLNILRPGYEPYVIHDRGLNSVIVPANPGRLASLHTTLVEDVNAPSGFISSGSSSSQESNGLVVMMDITF
jgi:hypothetical protein